MTTNSRDINRYLDEVGIKHANIGYRYLITAIEIGAEYPQMLYKISDLYEKVAQIYDTTEFKVERSIRYSILTLNQTNKEFISRVVDNITYNYNYNVSN